LAFNRLIELQIGIPGEIGTIIKDLRISFNVEKTDTESANKAEIQIYNLTDDTSNKIGKAGNFVIIKAGYIDEGINNLFFGNVTYSLSKKTGTEKILQIQAVDGVNNIQDINITVTYNAGTTIQKIFNDMVLLYGLPLTNTNLILPGQYVNGYVFTGKVKDALSQVLGRLNLSWTIQNNQLVVIESDKAIERTGLLISPNTGLIGSPEILIDTDTEPTEEPPVKYKIKCLLFPQLFPGVEFKLQSEKVNGTFKIETAKFTGDNYEGDFVCELEAVQI